MGIFNYNNPLIVLMVRLANMMIASFYWLLCCLPIVTVLPASAALYHCVNHVVMGSGAGVTRDFFRSFREALRPGVALTVLTEAVGALVYLGVRTGMAIWDKSIFGTVYMALGVLIVLLGLSALVHLPPVLSRFQGGVGVMLRLSVYFSGRNLPRALWCSVLLALGVWFVDFFPPALLVVPALYTDLTRRGMEKCMTRYIRQAGLEEEPEPQEERPQAAPALTALELDKMLTGEEDHG